MGTDDKQGGTGDKKISTQELFGDFLGEVESAWEEQVGSGGETPQPSPDQSASGQSDTDRAEPLVDQSVVEKELEGQQSAAVDSTERVSLFTTAADKIDADGTSTEQTVQPATAASHDPLVRARSKEDSNEQAPPIPSSEEAAATVVTGALDTTVEEAHESSSTDIEENPATALAAEDTVIPDRDDGAETVLTAESDGVAQIDDPLQDSSAYMPWAEETSITDWRRLAAMAAAIGVIALAVWWFAFREPSSPANITQPAQPDNAAEAVVVREPQLGPAESVPTDRQEAGTDQPATLEQEVSAPAESTTPTEAQLKAWLDRELAVRERRLRATFAEQQRQLEAEIERIESSTSAGGDSSTEIAPTGVAAGSESEVQTEPEPENGEAEDDLGPTEANDSVEDSENGGS